MSVTAVASQSHRGSGEGVEARYKIPTLHDVFRASQVIRRYLPRTPLLHSESLSAKLGFQLFLKCENLQPIGAFKVRGGLYLISRLPEAVRQRGVVAASTGNHGQSIAYAAREFGVRAVVFVPEDANQVKVASMRRLGAEIVAIGADFDDCRVEAERLAAAEGLHYIHSANEPDLIAGVGTYTLEILEGVPDLDALIVPIGAGSGACGAIIAGKGINRNLRVIGVQSMGAPVVRNSWLAGELLAYESMETFAEGIATRVAFELPLHILRGIDDVVLVSDTDLYRAILTLLENTRLLAEGAGAASLAAAHNLRDDLAGLKVAVVISGGNLETTTLAYAMNRERAW
jgi:threonine dehydratase